MTDTVPSPDPERTELMEPEQFVEPLLDDVWYRQKAPGKYEPLAEDHLGTCDFDPYEEPHTRAECAYPDNWKPFSSAPGGQ